MHPIIFKSLKIIIIFILVLSQEGFAQTKVMGKINDPDGYANVRSSPNGSIVLELINGTEVELLSKKGKWSEIKYKKMVGFIHSSRLRINQNKQKDTNAIQVFNAKIGIGEVTINSEEDGFVNFRKLPDLESEVYFDLPNDETAIVLKLIDKNWFKINYLGLEGYITAKKDQVIYRSYKASSQTKEIQYKVQVINKYVNLRNQPNGKIIKKIKKGTLLAYFKRKNGHYSIKYNNKKYYVSSNPRLTRLLKIEVNGKIDLDYVKCETKVDCSPISKIDSLLEIGDLNETQVALCRTWIEKLKTNKSKQNAYLSLQNRIQYMSQLNNDSPDAYRMCNLTSAAMCLVYLGVKKPCEEKIKYPDCLEKIRIDNDFYDKTHIDGWRNCIEKCGANVNIIANEVTENKRWYEKHILPELKNGNAVMMSISGHIVRVVSVTNEGMYVDDPYGLTKLKKGQKYSFVDKNSFGKEDNKGDNNLWTWVDVKKHSMRWVAAITIR